MSTHRKMIGIVSVVTLLTIFGYHTSWAQYGGDGSSMTSSDLESGQEEMRQMDSEMDVQPGDSTSSLEDKGMDVQSGDSIDSEGAGAH